VRSLIALAATAAPVCPALTTASAFPYFTRSTARLMDESFLRRTASTARSLMSTTCVAWTISIRRSLQPSFFNCASICAASPTRERLLIWGYSRRAITAPATRFGGPKSPPIASKAIFIGAAVCKFQRLNAKRKLKSSAAFIRNKINCGKSFAAAKRLLQIVEIILLRPLTPVVPCNNHMKDKLCVRRRCCHIANICSAMARANDAMPCACGGASSRFCVLELPYERVRKAGNQEKTTCRYFLTFNLSSALQSGFCSAGSATASVRGALQTRSPSRSQCG
jgi:hypothetical protein